MGASSSTYADLIEASGKSERLGQMGAALEQAQAALEIAQAGGDADLIAGALVRMAMVYFHQGYYPEACDLARSALEHAPRPSPGRARAFLLLGGAAAETNSLSAAEEDYNRALATARAIGDGHLLFCALHALAANVYIPRGQFELALAADQEAYQVACENHRDEYLYYPLITIAWAYRLTGQRDRLRLALDDLERVASGSAIPMAYHASMAAELAAELGDFERAEALHTRAFSLAEKCGEPALNVDVRLGLSRFYRLAGNAPVARDWADDAVAYAGRVGYSHRRGMALVERGRAFFDLADWPAVEADLQAAIGVLTPLQANCDLARACLLLAAALHAQERPETGAAWLEAGERIVKGGFGFLVEAERPLILPLIAHDANSADPNRRALAGALIEHLQRAPPPLQIITLGGFEVRRGGRPIPRSGWQRRSDELLRLLLISPGRSLSKDQIIEQFWPEKSLDAAATALHQATSCLRRALEPDLPEKFPSRYLRVEEGQISLCLSEGARVDYEIFEKHVQAGEWEAALDVYRGEPFQSDRYQGWASLKREQLGRLYLRALLAAARERFERADFEAARQACRRALVEDPWQEQAVLLGMQACLELGDRLGAIRMYKELERVLKEDLDIAPQRDLRQFYEALLK